MTEAAPFTHRSPHAAGVRIVLLKGLDALDVLGGIEVRGGFGSDLARRPGEPGVFYLLSDRGPNFDTRKPFERAFAFPSFTPSIGRFILDDDGLELDAVIPLRSLGGRMLSGLPNPPEGGGTGESPVTAEGQPLPLDRDGLDPEGLVALSDGTFWLSDDYGPHLLHVDAEGRTLAKINPFEGRRRLPRVFGRRRANRGMEGLAVTPDERTLVGIMQSPLANPTVGVDGESRVTRILTYDIASGGTRQYLLAHEDVGLSTSALTAVTSTTFLVIEHDTLLPRDHRAPSWIKRIYAIELDGATDVSDPADREGGLLIDGRTLEEMSPTELASQGIRLASKRLVLDLLEIGYPHDKPEGIVIIDDHTIGVLNDDDFGIRGGVRGVEPKLLPQTGDVSTTELWVISLPTSLAAAAETLLS